jgi:hypothetical protein
MFVYNEKIKNRTETKKKNENQKGNERWRD